jgi:hypothetical protein
MVQTTMRREQSPQLASIDGGSFSTTPYRLLKAIDGTARIEAWSVAETLVI